MLGVALVAPTSPLAVAVSVEPLAALSMPRSERDATPATGETVVVPSSVALGFPVPPEIAAVTLPVKPVAVLPKASRTATRTVGESGAPAMRSEEHTSELQSHHDLVCRLLLEKKKHKTLCPRIRTYPNAPQKI